MPRLDDIDLIVVHHSASPLSTSAKQIHSWHTAKGWSDTGYHRVIEATGRVYDGRPLQLVGAHARGNNSNSIGICVVGDNTTEEHRWTLLQEGSLALTIKYYSDLYPLAQVCGHRDTRGASTECPGLDIGDWCRERSIDVPLLKAL